MLTSPHIDLAWRFSGVWFRICAADFFTFEFDQDFRFRDDAIILGIYSWVMRLAFIERLTFILPFVLIAYCIQLCIIYISLLFLYLSLKCWLNLSSFSFITRDSPVDIPASAPLGSINAALPWYAHDGFDNSRFSRNYQNIMVYIAIAAAYCDSQSILSTIRPNVRRSLASLILAVYHTSFWLRYFAIYSWDVDERPRHFISLIVIAIEPLRD